MFPALFSAPGLVLDVARSRSPLVLDSPDIFRLRAPIVSCENLLTPGISGEFLLQ